jgi:hypothetical protein
MTSVSSPVSLVNRQTEGRLAEALASRLEKGAQALVELASSLSNAEWQVPIPKDGRKVGVVVHHVATMYPIEIQVAQTIASGQAVTGLTWDNVHAINAEHAKKHDGVGKAEALDLLLRNSVAAAAAIRALSDDELRRATPNSMYADAPLTCQFMLEDHAVRHSYHHLGKIRATLGR